MKLMKPAREGLAIPMPDRGNRLFSQDGETIDETMLYYSNLIASRDLIFVEGSSLGSSQELVADETTPISKPKKG